MASSEWFFPTAFSSWNEAEEAAIERVRASGRWTMGREVAAFEQELAAFHGRKHCIAVNSGSSANLVAVAALFHKTKWPLERHLTAIVPALSWATLYAPLVQFGLELDLLDCGEEWNAEPRELIRYDGPLGSGVVVACSILGNPANLPELERMANGYGFYFLNDDCESLGATINGRTTGSFGLMATESFFFSHQLSAIEGAAVLTDDDECDRLCRMLRSHGWTRDVQPAVSFEDEYRFEIFGYNLRFTELHAAVAREQLRKLPGFIKARQANAALFDTLTADLPITRPTQNGEPSPFGLQFTVDGGKEARARLVGALRATGIDCRLPTGGSLRKHAYGLPWANQATPRADLIHDTGLFLGCAPWDISEKVERAAKVIRETLS